jgi:hypothetical protein
MFVNAFSVIAPSYDICDHKSATTGKQQLMQKARATHRAGVFQKRVSGKEFVQSSKPPCTNGSMPPLPRLSQKIDQGVFSRDRCRNLAPQNVHDVRHRRVSLHSGDARQKKTYSYTACQTQQSCTKADRTETRGTTQNKTELER